MRLDLCFVREALRAFGEASRLRVNYQKSSATMIRGVQDDKDRVAEMLQCPIAEFPCRYLGLQLAICQLSRGIGSPSSTWYGSSSLLGKGASFRDLGILCSSNPWSRLDQSISFSPDWVFDEINAWMRSFFWAGKEKTNGG